VEKKYFQQKLQKQLKTAVFFIGTYCRLAVNTLYIIGRAAGRLQNIR